MAALGPRIGLVFFEDDVAGAAAEARRTGKPLFVDAWAPWCHTCLSMRARVLADPALANATLRSGARLGDAFVWLSVDTERVQNASFTAAHPNRVWPTLYVLSSDARTVRLAWEGSATREELVGLLSDLEAGGASARFAEAVAHAAAHRTEAARERFTAILEDEAAELGLRARSLEALVGLEGAAPEATVARVKAALPWLPRGTSRATAIVAALGALDALHKDDEALVSAARHEANGGPCAAKDPCAALAPDDRSGLFEALVDHAREAHDAEGAKAHARAWRTFLDATAADARTEEERYVYDAHRLLAAEALGDVAGLLPVLEASARRAPRDGNPRARLARAYAALARDEDAIREARAAVALLEGPRVLRSAKLLADLLERTGRSRDAAQTLRDATKKLAGFPLTKSQRALAEANEARANALSP